MTELEPLLRQHFLAEADGVPSDANLLGGVEALRHVRRRRRVLGGSATLGAAIVAAAIAVPLAVVGHHGGATRVTVSPNRPAVPATPPPGERAVTWAGIQFYVPAAWLHPDLGPGPCAADDHPGGAVIYASTVPTILVGCASLHPPKLEVLELGTAQGLTGSTFNRIAESPAPSSTSTAGTLAGLPAGYIRATVRGQMVTSVQVPSLGALFTVTTNTQARTDAILASAHQVSVDENGCAVNQPANLKKVAGGGPGGLQVPEPPVSGVVCSYAGGRLVMGVNLSAPELAAITAYLNVLPPRYTPAELAAQQAGSVLDRDGLASILLTYADGRRQQITVRSPSPGVAPGVAGITQSTLSQALSGELSALLPTGFGANAFQTGAQAELPTGSLGNLELTR